MLAHLLFLVATYNNFFKFGMCMQLIIKILISGGIQCPMYVVGTVYSIGFPFACIFFTDET